MKIDDLPNLDRHLIDTDSEHLRAYPMNYRVLSAMNGLLVAGPSEIADEIIDLLRSENVISREVRDALADAFVRGRGGNRPKLDDPNDVRPFIAVAGGGDRARLAKAVLVRRKWFDAAEELEQARLNGRKGWHVLAEIGGPHGLDVDMMKKARAFYNRFLAEYEDDDSDLSKMMRENGIIKEDFQKHQLHEEWKDICRSYFIEREASLLVGVAFEQFGG